MVDDHRVFAGALAERLIAEPGFDVVGVAHTREQALGVLRSTRPDVVLLDFRLGEDSGLDVLADLAARGAADLPAVLVVSAWDEVSDVVAALRLGARGWVGKDTSVPALLAAVSEVAAGRTSLGPHLLTEVLAELLGSDPASAPEPSFVDALTPRQREVLLALLDGATRNDIAERLVLSPHTVRTHVQELLRRSGSSSTLELLAKARTAGAARYRTHARPSPSGSSPWVSSPTTRSPNRR